MLSSPERSRSYTVRLVDAKCVSDLEHRQERVGIEDADARSRAVHGHAKVHAGGRMKVSADGHTWESLVARSKSPLSAELIA